MTTNESLEEVAHRHVKERYLNTTVERTEIIFLGFAVFLFSVLLGTFFGELTYDDIEAIVEIGYFLTLVIINSAIMIYGFYTLNQRIQQIPAAPLLQKIAHFVPRVAYIAFVVYMSWISYDLIRDDLVKLVYIERPHPAINSYIQVGFSLYLPLLAIVLIIRSWLTIMGWAHKILLPLGPLKRMMLKTQWGALSTYLSDKIDEANSKVLAQFDDLIQISHLAVMRSEELIKGSHAALKKTDSSLAKELQDVYRESQNAYEVWQSLRMDLENKKKEIVKFFDNTRKRTKVITGSSHEKFLVHSAKDTGYAKAGYKNFVLEENVRVAESISHDIVYIEQFLAQIHTKTKVKDAINRVPRASLGRLAQLEKIVSKIRDIEFARE